MVVTFDVTLIYCTLFGKMVPKIRKGKAEIERNIKWNKFYG